MSKTGPLLDLAYLAVAGKLFDPVTLFVTPNIIMRDRPEVYTIKTKKRVFIVNSGPGGINAHAHALKQTYPEVKIARAEAYFVCESEWFHDHPSADKTFYIARAGGSTTSDFSIFDYDTKLPVTHNEFSAGHYHALSIAEVIELTSGSPVGKEDRGRPHGHGVGERRRRSKDDGEDDDDKSDDDDDESEDDDDEDDDDEDDDDESEDDDDEEDDDESEEDDDDDDDDESEDDDDDDESEEDDEDDDDKMKKRHKTRACKKEEVQKRACKKDEAQKRACKKEEVQTRSCKKDEAQKRSYKKDDVRRFPK